MNHIGRCSPFVLFVRIPLFITRVSYDGETLSSSGNGEELEAYTGIESTKKEAMEEAAMMMATSGHCVCFRDIP